MFRLNKYINHFLTVVVALLAAATAQAGFVGETINVPAGASVALTDKASYSDNSYAAPAGSGYTNIISNQLSVFYDPRITDAITGTLTMQNNVLSLPANRSYAQTDAGPIAGARFYMSNNWPNQTTDLSALSVTLSTNVLNTDIHADISGAQGNLFGALLEVENTNIGTISISSNTVNAAIDTNETGTQIFGAEVILNATNANSALVMSQDVFMNTVNIDDGIVRNEVIGGEILGVIKDNGSGMTISGHVDNNLVNISRGTIQTPVVGGVLAVDSKNHSQTLTLTGDVKNNEINVTDGEFNNAILAGGSISLEGYKAKDDSVLTSSVHDNKVTITGGTFTDTIIMGGVTTANDWSGATVTGDIANNTVSISGDVTFNGDNILYGGFTNGTNAVTGNELILGSKGLSVYGVDGFDKYTFDLTAANNADVYLTSKNGNGHNNILYQNFTDNAAVNGNWDISGATISWTAAGRPTNLNLGNSVTLLKSGSSKFGFDGTIANDGETQNIVDGTATYTYVLHQREKSIDLVHTGLAVTGDWAQDVVMSGGNYSGDDVTMTVSGKLSSSNITVISNSVAGASLTAGTLDLSGNNTSLNLQSAKDKELLATFTTIDIGDGHSLNKTGNGFYTFTNMNLTGNAYVNSLDVMGNAATVTLGSGVNATVPVINLVDGANLTMNTSGGGAYSFDTLNSYGTGNTLTGDLSAANKNLNFYLADTTAAGATALSVTGDADVTNSTIKVGITGSSSALKLDDTVTLLDAGTLTGTPGTLTGVGMQGLMVKYQFDVAASGNQLVATVTNTQLSENAKAFSEGRAASAAFLIQGADFAAQEGMSAAQTTAEHTSGLATFAVVGGGKSRYETGSHVDITGFNAAVGLSHIIEGWFNADWLLGSFVEYGNGSYDSYNTFFSGDVKGSGNDQYIGLGVLGKRMTYHDNYFEISARAGQASSDFEGYVYSDSVKADYDYKAMYYGAHMGLGHIWQWSKNSTFDLFGKYYWTHEDGKSVILSSGDGISFGHTNSSRVRIGGKINQEWNARWSGYVGASFDYEMHGKMKATTYGMDIDAPNISGGTGVGEVGLTYTKDAITLGVGGTGYIGKRRGGSGHIKFGYSF